MKKLKAIAILLSAFLISPTIADDIFTPFWRGQERTVAAEWDNWSQYPADILPDWWESNPILDQGPTASANDGTMLWDEFEGRTNVMQLNQDRDIIFDIPNFIGGETKKIRMQVTYYLPHEYIGKKGIYIRPAPRFSINAIKDGQILPEYNGTDMLGPDYIEFRDIYSQWDQSDKWVTVYYDLDIEPNPDREIIALSFIDMTFPESRLPYPVYVDQVVIDTHCRGEIPEPATVGLLAIGSMSIIAMKRKK